MITGFMEKLFKKNSAPEWYVNDIRNNVSDAEIKEKIKVEIRREVAVRNYDETLWTDEFIGRMAGLYQGFFDQLYMESAA